MSLYAASLLRVTQKAPILMITLIIEETNEA